MNLPPTKEAMFCILIQIHCFFIFTGNINAKDLLEHITH